MRTQAVKASEEDLRAASQLWWLLAVVGLFSAAAGVILIARPSDSLKVLSVVVGIFLLIDGIVELVSAFGARQDRALAAIIGVLGIVVGIVLIRHPFHAVNAIGLLIGIWLVAAGTVRLFRAIALGVHRLLLSLVAAVEIVVGIVIVSDPHIGYTALAVIAGIWLILNGIGTVAVGVTLRAVRPEEPTSDAQTR